jgi:hypothetical protein
MLKYFATPLWAIHTTRGVQDVVKWISEVHKRPPDIMHVACKWRRALGAHDPATASQMFATFALAFRRSWGMCSCWYEGLPDPLFPASHPCSVFLSCFRQQSSSYWKARKCQNMPAMRTNPVSQEPFGTVPDRS